VYPSRLIPAAALCLCAAVLDQLTKLQVRAALEVGQSVHLVGSVYLTHVENTGAVFGLGQGYVLIPTIATLFILILIPFIVRHLYVRYGYVLTRLEAACVGLIAGGAIGNLIDRIARSAVTDFVDVVLFPGYHWPAFNVADASVVVGTLILLVAFMRHGASGVERNANS
jgi:signal peptidase II